MFIDVDAELQPATPDDETPPTPTEADGYPRGATPPSTSTPTLPAKMPAVGISTQKAKALTLADRHQALIARVDDKVRTRATKVMADAMLAAQVDEPGSERWSARQRRTAADARLCGKEAPVYLSMAAKVLDSYKRAETNKAPVSPELHADIKVYVRQELTVNYRTMDLEDKEE